MTAGRCVLHSIILVGGWLLYLYLCWHLRNYPGHLIAHIWELIFVFGALILVLTTGWVLHKTRSSKNKVQIERKTIKSTYTKDWEQRLIIADWERLKNANHIKIIIKGNKKIYREM